MDENEHKNSVHFHYSSNMATRFASWLFKYIYYSNLLSGFVLVGCNFSKKKVEKSMLKMSYALLWRCFFVVNFKNACKASYEVFQAIYFSNETVSDTIQLEETVSIVMVILISIVQFKNIGISVELFAELFDISRHEDFKFELFDSNLGKQIGVMALFGDIGVTYLYFMNLFWIYKNGSSDIFSLNPLKNSVLNGSLVIFPISLVSRLSMFIAFCIVIILKFLEALNRKVQNAVKLANNSQNFSMLHKEMKEIEKLYGKVINVIRLFEENFGWVIVILQCVFLIVGINQVGSYINNLRVYLIFEKLFYLYSSSSLSESIGQQQVSLLIFCSIHFFQVCLVKKKLRLKIFDCSLKELY